MLDLDLARLVDGDDQFPEGLESAVWNRVAALEGARRLLRLTTRVQLLALSVALFASIALGVIVAEDIVQPAPSARISAVAASLAPSTLLSSVVS